MRSETMTTARLAETFPAAAPAVGRQPAPVAGRRPDVEVVLDARSPAGRESVYLLDGGDQAYPRMLLAIAGAQRSVHLEVYAFAPGGVGARFVVRAISRVFASRKRRRATRTERGL